MAGKGNGSESTMSMTAKQLSGLFGVTVKTIAEWVKQGMPKKAFNVYDSGECMNWWQEHINAEKEQKTGSVRDRYWLAKAEVEEIKAAKLKGELAPIAEFERNEAYRMAQLRGSLLALPGRLALALEMKGREEVREVLKREGFTMLDSFRRSKSYLADGCAPEFEEDAEPKKKPVKRKKVSAKKRAKK